MIGLTIDQHYVRSTEDTVAEEAVRAIGSCIRKQPEVAASGLSTLMKLLKSTRGEFPYLVVLCGLPEIPC